MGEILEGMGDDQRRRIKELKEAGHFFWIDLVSGEVSPEALAEALGIDDRALQALLDFDPSAPPSQRFHIDGKHVAFAMGCYVETPEDEQTGLPLLEGRERESIDVRVLVAGDYLLTIHEEQISLPQLLQIQEPSGRSEQYMVYAVLDAMVATAYDALNQAEMVLEEMLLSAAAGREARLRMTTLRQLSARLSEMRRSLGPQRGLFERISEEIGRIEGLEPDSERYFDRIRNQLGRLVDGLDYTANTMAQVIDLRLNSTMYRLTVVATIFLPLTFIVGFFGMNFGWMVNRIDTFAGFVLLGLVLPLLLAATTWRVVQLRERPVATARESER
jgi:magnesium transporter